MGVRMYTDRPTPLGFAIWRAGVRMYTDRPTPLGPNRCRHQAIAAAAAAAGVQLPELRQIPAGGVGSGSTLATAAAAAEPMRNIECAFRFLRSAFSVQISAFCVLLFSFFDLHFAGVGFPGKCVPTPQPPSAVCRTAATLPMRCRYVGFIRDIECGGMGCALVAQKKGKVTAMGMLLRELASAEVWDSCPLTGGRLCNLSVTSF